MKNQKEQENPRLRQTFLNDIKQGGFFTTLRREWKEIRDFYIDDERIEKLSDMGRLRRWLYFAFWLMKSLFLKLTPARRLLLLLAIIFSAQWNQTGAFSGNLFFAGLLLLFILMLELKDKLLAKEELDAGRSVQFALMPETMPRVAGWDIWLYSQPAREVGGDMVDCITVNANRYALALGDVAGKGLGAALFMARLQAVLRALAPDYEKPARLIEKINIIFHRDRMPNSFASLFYLELQPDSDMVKYVNAGHLPPIVLRQKIFKELEKGQPALGLMDHTKYTERSFRMKKGEILLVYSDGLSEAKTEQNEFFGERRIRDILGLYAHSSAQDIGRHLLLAVKQFINDSALSDDLSLLIVKKL